MAIVLLGTMLVVEAATQTITPEPSHVAVAAGQPFIVRLRYDVSNAEPGTRLSGLGIRIHFDSARLRFLGLENVLDEGKVGEDTQPVDDESDADLDPRTDKMVQIAWLDKQGDWAAREMLPVNLLQARFVVLPGSNSSTVIRLSRSGGPTGTQFRSTPVVVSVR